MGVKPIQRRRQGSWWVRINWTFRSPETGEKRTFRKTKYIGEGEEGKEAATHTAEFLQKAYKKYGAEAIKLLESPTTQEPTQPRVTTFGEFADSFLLREQASGHKGTTYKCYESNLRVHLKPAFGSENIKEIDYGKIADFLATKAGATYSSARFRVEREKDKRDAGVQRAYSKNSLRLMTMTLRAVMAEAVRERIIPVNPVAGFAKYYRKRKKDRQITRADVFRPQELHSIEDRMAERFPEYWEFTLAQSREGMRVGEAMGLLIKDIDFARGTINIDKNIPAGTGELADSAKTEHSDRVIEFWSEDLREALVRMLARRKEQALAAGRPQPAPTDYLFCEPSGHFVNYSRFVQAWNKCQHLAEVTQRPPHALRHSWASIMISAGEDIAAVSKHLGHANAGVTLGIYTHFVPGTRRQAGNVLDRKNATKTQPRAFVVENGKPE